MLRSLAWASLGTGFIFLMTTLGAAVVFFFAGEIKLRLQAVMMGFAAGVMLAASVWSMIIPAVERTRAAGAVAVPAAMEQRTPLELFEALYLQQNNQPMSDEQRAFAAQLMEEIQEVQP